MFVLIGEGANSHEIERFGKGGGEKSVGWTEASQEVHGLVLEAQVTPKTWSDQAKSLQQELCFSNLTRHGYTPRYRHRSQGVYP